MKKLLSLAIISFIFLSTAACQGDTTDSTITPPIVAATATDVAASTSTPTEPDVSEPVTEPPTVTAEPTRTAAAPTAEATATPAPAVEPSPTSAPAPASLATSIQLVPVLDGGLRQPTSLTHAFDQRLFVTEQAGTIGIVENGQLRQEPFLDIRDRVGSSASEQGLLSVAFHPNYASNGRFFVNYTNRSGNTVIARYQVSAGDPNQADYDSEIILLTINQPYGNHNGGQIKFGPDGYLYVGMGDGGSAGDPQNHGQNPATLLGALLRLDVDHEDNDAGYAIPTDNPFVGDDSRRNEIWAIGLRNPWRFSFDRLTGDMYLADVGQNQWEEVHFQPAGSPGGENYGWNILEGSHCYRSPTCDTTGLELPVFEYDHSQGCSITGGYVYRGQQFPSLNGNYFTGDYCSGNIWSLLRQNDGAWTWHRVSAGGLIISTFGEDANGELYVLDHRGGRILQIQP